MQNLIGELLEEFERLVEFAVEQNIIPADKSWLIRTWDNFISSSFSKVRSQTIEEIKEMCKRIIPTRDTLITIPTDKDIRKTTRTSLVAMGYAQALFDILTKLQELENKKNEIPN